MRGKLHDMKKAGLKNDGHFEKVHSQKMVPFMYRDQYGPFRYKRVCIK